MSKYRNHKNTLHQHRCHRSVRRILFNLIHRPNFSDDYKQFTFAYTVLGNDQISQAIPRTLALFSKSFYPSRLYTRILFLRYQISRCVCECAADSSFPKMTPAVEDWDQNFREKGDLQFPAAGSRETKRLWLPRANI